MRQKSRIFLTLFLALILLSANLLAQQSQRRRMRVRADDGAPKVGDVAPLFKLKLLDGKKEVDLNELVGKKPIILIFGSYT